MLSKERYLESFGTDAATLLDLAGDAPDAAVAHCGEWLAADLVAHLAGVWGFFVSHVEARAAELSGSMTPPDLEGAPLFEHARDLATSLSELLAGLDPDEPVWSWTSDKTGGFYLRRAAQETSVHLWDMRTAVGLVEALPADMARDGIDELADVTYQNLISRDFPEPTGSLHLHCTDGDGEWTLSSIEGEVAVAREHAKGDAAIRAAASDLNLALWERVPLSSDALQVFGATDVAASWTALTR